MTEINPVSRPLGWLGIVRMGLVQMSLGAIIVLTTSTLNRVMVVELGLLASLPGALVGLHYAIQVLRPRWGYGSDVGGRRTPWIIGGMFVLGAAAIMAAVATMLLETSYMLGMTLSVIAFLLIGCGVGASGTSLLVLLAVRVDQRRCPAAATIVWLISGPVFLGALGRCHVGGFSWCVCADHCSDLGH
jgi:BCD family chlorophyll transporter-like MFS transporter